MAQGRKRGNWLSFVDARQVVRDESIGHRADYFRWHDLNKPKQIPKQPRETYSDEWISWNDFLGNENEFKGGKKVPCRPYIEAVAYVHSLHLRVSSSWFEYIREHGIPDDVPSHPELYYDSWISWNHWLGNTVSGRAAAAQDIVTDAGVLYLIAMPNRPGNVVRIGIESGGLSALLTAQQKQHFKVIKVFKMELDYDWQAVVDLHASPWWDSDAKGDEYVVSNIHELGFDLFSDLVPA